MKQYLQLLDHVLKTGTPKSDRTGTGTLSVFGYQMRFDLKQGFPLVTTKKLHLRSIIHELLCFLSGDTNIKYLNDNKVTIWNEWADASGSIGDAYGHQWRAWPSSNGEAIDQISNVIANIKTDPDSRRLIVSAWNVAELDNMALPPCHLLFQFYVSNQHLSCQLYIRSSDVYLGLPFNTAQYALLTHMIAQQCELNVGDLLICLADTHIYSNHRSQAELQLTRTPYPLPTLSILRKPPTIFDYKYEDFQINDYQYHPHIAAPVAV